MGRGVFGAGGQDDTTVDEVVVGGVDADRGDDRFDELEGPASGRGVLFERGEVAVEADLPERVDEVAEVVVVRGVRERFGAGGRDLVFEGFDQVVEIYGDDGTYFGVTALGRPSGPVAGSGSSFSPVSSFL